jgi:hypothetical protein
VPQEAVAIDESLMKFRGRLSWGRIQSSKRAIFWIKFCVLCESNSSCCVSVKICTNDDTVEGSDKNASENVLLELAKSILACVLQHIVLSTVLPGFHWQI